MTISPPTTRPDIANTIDANDWMKCPACSVTIYLPRVRRAMNVCPECGHHHRIGAVERIIKLVDSGSWWPAEAQVRGADPLRFVDSVPYPERLEKARSRTGMDDAAVYGAATIGGVGVVVTALDFRFLGGSMGSAVGETIARSAELALSSRMPLLVLTTSGGARMQEGCLSLMQMAKTAQAMRSLQRNGVLSLCLLSDPTFGGVTASFATLADILVAEQGALIGFAGPRVIANATRERLPDGFQTAEYLLAKGKLDRVETRKAVRPLLRRILTAYAGADVVPRRPGSVVVTQPSSPSPAVTAAETLALARDIQRPTTTDYLGMICDDFIELHGDRAHGDDPAIVGGLATLSGRPIIVIGHQKGHDTAELVARNFGMPHPEGYRKASRLMRLAERLGLPVVTFVDTQGAAPGIGAEERGQAWTIADCIADMGELRVPVVSTIIGEGGSGGALALAVANRVLMLEHACYSVISPESCSTILFGDPSRGGDMADALKITASELLRLGVVDGVIREPEGGAQHAAAAAAETIKAAVVAELDDLGGLDADELVKHRFERFRRIGVAEDV